MLMVPPIAGSARPNEVNPGGSKLLMDLRSVLEQERPPGLTHETQVELVLNLITVDDRLGVQPATDNAASLAMRNAVLPGPGTQFALHAVILRGKSKPVKRGGVEIDLKTMELTGR